jgi:putative N6-adenine-specific DNA methylase
MNKMQYVATTLFGLEDILSDELIGFGAEKVIKMNRAVGFSASNALMYKINLGSRFSMRILKNIDSFTASDPKQLYNRISDIRWEDYFSIRNSFMINSAVNSRWFTHSHFVSQKVKDAIADRFRKIKGFRPSVNTGNPEIVIHVHISDDRVNVSLDSSGEPLFKRGYRAGQYIAPLNEILAAGMLKMAGWTGKGNLVDPMCGSGTIPIEAAMIAKNIPPGILRDKFSFMYWADYDQKLFDQVREGLMNPIEFDGTISASDISAEAVSLTKRNLRKALLTDYVRVKKEDIRNSDPPAGGGLVLINPPYGERLKEDELESFYQQIGDTLKRKYDGYTVWILSANAFALKFLGLHPDKKLDMVNGTLKCKFQKFIIYRGSMKKNRLEKGG